MISLEGVTVTLIPGGRPALDNVSLEIAPGELVAVVGPNGSGKSTLARVLAGIVEPDAGRVVRDGETSDVGFVAQSPAAQMIAPSVAEEIAFGLEQRAVPHDVLRQRVRHALERYRLADLADRAPSALSGGQQQRVAVAALAVLEPAVLVLDEPTSQLDEAHRADVWDAATSLVGPRASVVWVTQHPAEAAACPRVIALLEGHVVFDGPPRGLFAQPDLVARLGIGVPDATRLALALTDHGVGLSQLPIDEHELMAALGTT